MSVRQIRDEAALATKIADMLDAAPRFETALKALDYVRDRLWAAGDKWAFEPGPAACLEAKPPAWRAIGPGLLSLFLTFLWPFVLASVVVFGLGWWAFGFATGVWLGVIATVVWYGAIVAGYVMLRRYEERDPVDSTMPPADKVAKLMAHENFALHNHLASTSIMKPEWLRYHTLRLGLWYASIYSQHFSRPSFLGAHGGIHFARWVLLPGTDQLLFRSNYDGTWGGYVEDFVELSSRGVNGIWSNTIGFAKTTNLLHGGSEDSDRLMRWSRRQQQPSHCWYTAYPRLTLARIRTNAAIRQGISLARTEDAAADWLSCFGSTPRPVSSVELPEVPTLVCGGLSRLRFSSALVLTLAPDAEAGRQWLAGVERDIAYGNASKAGKASVVALSASGLRKLGFEDAHLSSFPVAFQHGMAAPWRARVLGDVGKNAPESWQWGGPKKPADAILLVYADGEEACRDDVAARVKAAEALGHQVVEIGLMPLPEEKGVKEPFGFADGISQPLVRGIRQTIAERDRNHAVEPGEMVLGYPDNFGFVAPTPSIPGADDPNGLLPASGDDFTRQRPNFADAQPAETHDIGRNGSYLVVRQLEQHVDAFDGFAREAAERHKADPRWPQGLRIPGEEWIKAKMVGRWKDGTSLVRHPDVPGNWRDKTKDEAAPAPALKTVKPDNDYLFGTEDPGGLRCPFGAHVRRTNPRDSLEPGSEKRIQISNRHRILRVGRAYGEVGQGGAAARAKGLLFMCLNADIERQFEFVQQMWLMGPSFHSLEHEVDPTVGHGGAIADKAGEPRCFTIPTVGGPLRLKGLKDFVTMKGGEYFFLPSRRALHYLAAGGVVAKAEGEPDAAPARPAEAREDRRAAE